MPQETLPLREGVREIEILRARNNLLVTKLAEKNMQLERQLRLFGLSIDVGSALMHGRSLPETLRGCCEALVRHLDATSATIWTYQERRKVLEWRAGAGEGAEDPNRVVAMGEMKIGLAAEKGKPQIVRRASEEACVPGQERLAPESRMTFAAYPLIAGTRLLGVMAIFGRRPFADAALDKVAAVAVSIALSVERKRSEEELRAALTEKTTLLQEVHHRVKNNLQVICSLLAMQIECAPDGTSSGPLNDAHARVLAVSLIHEQIYQAESLADLDFGDYVRRLADRVFLAYCVNPSRVTMAVDVAPIHVSVDRAIPCGLILNEFLSNSLKHAFRDGRQGTIRIWLHRTEDNWAELEVADNGVGFAADFKWDEGRSLGLKIVKTLVNQLRGELSVSGDGGGTFRLRWPLLEGETESDITA
jgi:two-component sensor histidine kinase